MNEVKGVKSIIAVASGKGGVGKSTTSVNLALALQAEGARVGVLDADIYGPNIPHMLGASEKPEIIHNKMHPVICHGLQTMSIAYLMEQTDTPMIWRGPIVTKSLVQLLFDTAWDNLDILILDLPPGTGDIQLTLAQKVKMTGGVIVSTPQDIALLDARKAVRMFQKVNIPVLGVIENMSTHHCSECGHTEAIFGSEGVDEMASRYELDVLGRLPLALRIREDVDKGTPTVAVDPNSEISQTYRKIATNIMKKCAVQQRVKSNDKV